MGAEIFLTLIFITITLAYILVTPKLYLDKYQGIKIPPSLSASWYYMKEPYRPLFTVWAIVSAFLLVQPILDSTDIWYIQLFGFLSIVSLAFIGCAPQFAKKTHLDSKVHLISTVSLLIFALLYTILMGQHWLVISCISLAVFIAIANKNWLLWLEVAVIVFVCGTLIFYYGG